MSELVKNLKKADDELNILQDEDIVVVIGNTGCGKSTMLSSLIYGVSSLYEKKIQIEVPGAK